MRDLIVVGAGPAGSQVAKGFAEKGLDVLMIERSEEVGQPLACSGHVSPDIKNFLSDKEFQDILQNKIKGAKFHANNQYHFFREEPVSYVIDRVEFDKKKALQAKGAGAELKKGENVEKVIESEEKVVVETSEASYEAKMVAGCDGASSKVRDEAGLPEPDHFYQGVLCFTDEEDSSDHVDVTLDVPSFFGWRIPRTDSVEYGAAVPKGEEPMEWLDKVTERFEVNDKRNICAGAIPIGPANEVTTERVFLVGDAAAQTKPFTGGGILYGMRAANKAVENVDLDQPDSLESYEKAWRSELENEIRLGGFIEMFYSMPEVLQRPVLRFFEGEIGVHMDRPTSLLSVDQLKAMMPIGGIKNYHEEIFPSEEES